MNTLCVLPTIINTPVFWCISQGDKELCYNKKKENKLLGLPTNIWSLWPIARKINKTASILANPGVLYFASL